MERFASLCIGVAMLVLAVAAVMVVQSGGISFLCNAECQARMNLDAQAAAAARFRDGSAIVESSVARTTMESEFAAVTPSAGAKQVGGSGACKRGAAVRKTGECFQTRNAQGRLVRRCKAVCE